MAMTQIKAITPDLLQLVKQHDDRNLGRNYIWGVLSYLAAWSTGDGTVSQSINQISLGTGISASTIKRVLAATERARVSTTIHHGGGEQRKPTTRMLNLDYDHNGLPRPYGSSPAGAQTTTNSDPDNLNSSPDNLNSSPKWSHTERSTENSPSISSTKVEEVIQLVVKAKQQKRANHIKNPDAWAKHVANDVRSNSAERIHRLLELAPTAPASLIASCIEDGTSQALAPYCK